MSNFFVKFLCLVPLCVSLSYANEYRYEENIELAKDEVTSYFVKYDSGKKLFEFRWTLYANKGLVVLRSYDRVVGQNVLYADAKRTSFKVDVKPHGEGHGLTPYILVKFEKFDFEKNKAIFKFLLWDENREIKIEKLQEK